MVHDYILLPSNRPNCSAKKPIFLAANYLTKPLSSYDPKLCQLFGTDEANDKLAPVINWPN